MFLALFGVSFALALALSFTVAWVSKDAIETVLRRFVADSVVRAAFSKYLRFAMVVVGISVGTRVSPLQEYMAASYSGKVSMLAAVNQEYWVMEIYHTILGTLEGLVWLLLSANSRPHRARGFALGKAGVRETHRRATKTSRTRTPHLQLALKNQSGNS
jgi:hypothetical protein